MKFEKENFKNAHDLPIYKKGKEIYDVIDRICQVIETDVLFLGKEKDAILNAASLLSSEVETAEHDQSEEQKMKSAAIIQNAADLLPFRMHSIAAYGFTHVEYFQIVLPMIDEYRLLFIDWVAGFRE